jgi:hypothetical protein
LKTAVTLTIFAVGFLANAVDLEGVVATRSFNNFNRSINTSNAYIKPDQEFDRLLRSAIFAARAAL